MLTAEHQEASEGNTRVPSSFQRSGGHAGKEHGGDEESEEASEGWMGRGSMWQVEQLSPAALERARVG